MERYTRKLIGDDDERAVSPVIGVILMVAITVILAAVIAAFVLDIGPGGEPVQAAVDYEAGEITVTNADNVDDITSADDEDCELDSDIDEPSVGDTEDIDCENSDGNLIVIGELGDSEEILYDGEAEDGA